MLGRHRGHVRIGHLATVAECVILSSGPPAAGAARPPPGGLTSRLSSSIGSQAQRPGSDCPPPGIWPCVVSLGTVPGSRVNLRDRSCLMSIESQAGAWSARAPDGEPLRCANCGREPREDENADDEWRVRHRRARCLLSRVLAARVWRLVVPERQGVMVFGSPPGPFDESSSGEPMHERH